MQSLVFWTYFFQKLWKKPLGVWLDPPLGQEGLKYSFVAQNNILLLTDALLLNWLCMGKI